MIAGIASQFVAAGSIIFFSGGSAAESRAGDFHFKYKYKVTKFNLVTTAILGIISIVAASTIATENNSGKNNKR